MGGILTAIFKRSKELKKERRDSLANPSQFLVDFFTGGKTLAGVTVDENTALTISQYLACIRNVSEDVGKIPTILYEKKTEDNRQRATSHPLYSLLKDRPNEHMSALDFKSTLNGHGMGVGNGYAEIVFNGAGRIHSLWPLLPRNMRLSIEGGQGLIYWYRSPKTGNEKALDPAQVFHLKNFSPDGYLGYSILRLARESVGLGISAERAAASVFGKGLAPSGVLTHPGELSLEAGDRLEERFKKHQGGDNAGGILLLEEGLQFTKTMMSLADAQYIETRKFSIEDAARWFRIPPHKIQYLEHATFSNIGEQNEEYRQETLTPWFKRWEHEICHKLLPDEAKKNFTVEFETDAVLRGNPREEVEIIRTEISSGTLTPDEARRLKNRPPLAKGAGKKALAQGAMTTLEKIVADDPKPEPKPEPPKPDEEDEEGEESEENGGTPPNPPGEPGRPGEDEAARNELRQAVSVIIEDVAERILRVEADKLTRGAKGARSLESFAREMYARNFHEYMRNGYARALKGAAWSFEAARGGTLPDSGKLERLLEFTVKAHTEESLSLIRARGLIALKEWPERASRLADTVAEKIDKGDL